MVPLWIELKISRRMHKPFQVVIPFLVIWLILLPLLAIIVPFWLIVSLMMALAGYGWSGIIMLIAFFSILFNLEGLTVDVKNGKNEIHFKYHKGKERIMVHEKRKILEMLSEGKISVEESERLLNALGERDEEIKTGSNSRLKYLRVLVEPADDHPEGDRVNIRVPLNLIRAGLKWASFIPKEAQSKVEEAMKKKGMDMDFKQLKPEDLEDLIGNLNDLQVQVEGKENVRIFCE